MLSLTNSKLKEISFTSLEILTLFIKCCVINLFYFLSE